MKFYTKHSQYHTRHITTRLPHFPAVGILTTVGGGGMGGEGRGETHGEGGPKGGVLRAWGVADLPLATMNISGWLSARKHRVVWCTTASSPLISHVTRTRICLSFISPGYSNIKVIHFQYETNEAIAPINRYYLLQREARAICRRTSKQKHQLRGCRLMPDATMWRTRI